MSRIRYLRRFVATWLVCGTVCAMEPASRYEPSPLPIRTFWLSIDTSSSAETFDSQWLHQQIAVLDSVLREPWSAQRPMPSEGISLGLLAVTAPDGVAREVHPSVPLESTRTWPAERVERTLRLSRNPLALPLDDEVWSLGQERHLRLQWPLPNTAIAPAAIEWLTLSIVLPLRVRPSQWPAFTLAFPDGTSFPLDPPSVTEGADAIRAQWSLISVLQRWQQEQGSRAWPAMPWTLHWQAQQEQQQGAWQHWQPDTPAEVTMVWDEPSAMRSGREQLRRQLAHLLPGEGLQLPANHSALQAKSQSLLKVTSDCEQAHLLEISANHVVSAEQLGQWRDRALAPPAVTRQKQARVAPSGLIAMDTLWEHPIPGRIAWSGGYQQQYCQRIELCQTPPTIGAHIEPLPAQLWLTDVAPNQPLESLISHWPRLKNKHPFWQSELALPDTPRLRGASLYVDAGESVAMPTGRLGLMLWLASDGSVQAQEANTGAWRWGWRPQESLARWAVLSADTSLPISQADTRYVITQDMWALWPPTNATVVNQGLDHLGQRWLYGLVDQHWVVLNLSTLAQPASGFLPLSASAVPRHPAQQHRWGSVSLWPLRLEDNQVHPLLLLSTAETTSSAPLMLIEGRQGSVLWQASALQHPGLDKPWRAAWQQLPMPDHSFLAYGVDESGGVWRLRVAAPISAYTSLTIRLNRVADFSELGRVFMHRPSLAWLRDRHGALRPGISVTASATQDNANLRTAAVLAFVDKHDIEAAEASIVPLRVTDLTPWQRGARPPDHDQGWFRELAASELIAQPARWLAEHLVLVSEQPAASASACPEWAWQARIYRWPWRRERDGKATFEAMTELPVSAQTVGDPYLSESGALGWLGVSVDDNPTGSLAVPVGYRQRIQQRQLRDDD